MTAEKARLAFIQALYKRIEYASSEGRLKLVVADLPESVKILLEEDGYTIIRRTPRYLGWLGTGNWTDYRISWKIE